MKKGGGQKFVVVNVGTYEHTLETFWLWRKDKDTVLSRSVSSYMPHIASITALAARGSLLVSGSADETLHVYDLRKRIETGRMDEHKGTITGIGITEDAEHMVTSGEDGALCLWETKTFDCTKTIEKAHGKGGVLSLSVHPSGKAALTLGRKGLVRLWDLHKGVLAAAMVDDPYASCLTWLSDGASYVVASGRTVLLRHASDTKTVAARFEHKTTVLCLQALDGSLFAAGCSDGRVYIWDSASKQKDKEPVCILEEHTTRVRAMGFLSGKNKPLDCDKGILVTSATNGEINVFGCVSGEWELLTGRNVDSRVQAVAVSEIVATDLPAAFFRPEEDDDKNGITDIIGEDDPRYDSDNDEDEDGETGVVVKEEEEEDIMPPKNKKKKEN